MFILLAGPRSIESEGLLERMAAPLRGGEGAPRFWRDAHRNAGAASRKPHFTPEDAGDVQPVITDDFVLVAQVRLDHRETSQTADATLLAEAYARWGEDCVQHITGDFAFAVWHRDGRVFAAVDHSGMRRLFWTRVGNAIALSPQLASLFAHPHVSHEPDLQALGALFRSGVDRTATPFASIRALPGGHTLSWRAGEVRVERWWNPEWTPSVWYRDPREYVDETRELFTRAVAANLRSSSPVSAMLSGGLDSGSVAATAARVLATPLTAYTAIPEEGLRATQRPNWEADDREYAREVVAACGNIEHHLVAPAGRCVLEALPPVLARSLTPPKSTTNFLWLDRISTMVASTGSRVLLTGGAGNTGFSWRGAGAIAELARSGRPRRALTQAAVEARQQQRSVPRVLAAAMREAWRARFGKTLGAALVPLGLHFVQPAFRPRSGTNEYVERPGSRSFWRTALLTPKQIWSPEPVAQWGIEWRDPTIDRRLVERLLRYPQAAFRIDGRDRGLARAVAAGVLPDRVRLRRTSGAQMPEAPALIAAHARHYRETLAGMRESARCRALFDLAAIDRALEAIASGANDDYYFALVVDRTFAVGLFLIRLEQ